MGTEQIHKSCLHPWSAVTGWLINIGLRRVCWLVVTLTMNIVYTCTSPISCNTCVLNNEYVAKTRTAPSPTGLCAIHYNVTDSSRSNNVLTTAWYTALTVSKWSSVLMSVFCMLHTVDIRYLYDILGGPWKVSPWLSCIHNFIKY